MIIFMNYKDNIYGLYCCSYYKWFRNPSTGQISNAIFIKNQFIGIIRG